MDNASRVVFQLLHELNLKVDPEVIEETLYRHPGYPSLLSISDVLTDWGIENNGFYLEKNEYNSVNTPFLAHFNDNNFAVIKEVKEDSVLIIDKYHEVKSVSLKLFSSRFTGHILKAEKSSNEIPRIPVESKRKVLLKKIRLPFFLVSIVAILLTLVLFSDFLHGITIRKVLLIISLLIGTFTSVLLLIQSVDNSNPFIAKLCGRGKSNCKSILNSKAARILWGSVSWAEVGFVYFFGSLMIFLFNSSVSSIVHFLAVLSLLALPYTVYSLLYQGVVAKHWCLLCCTIQGVILIQFLLMTEYLVWPFSISLSDCVLITLSFFMPAIAWIFFKPFALEAQKVPSITKQLNGLKNDINVFQVVLRRQPKYPLLKPSETLMIGSAQPENVITIVTNPYCGVCENAFAALEDLVSNFRYLSLQVVFAIDDINNVEPIATHLYHLEKEYGIEKVQAALFAWHKQETKDFEKWRSDFPVKKLHSVADIVQKNKEWCSFLKLEFTPLVLINGYKVPADYELEQIRYFLINNKFDTL